MARVTWIAEAGWEFQPAGLRSYLTLVRELLSRSGVQGEIVGLPVEFGAAAPSTLGPDAVPGEERISAWRLAMGYLGMIRQDVRRLSSVSGRVAGRVIVTNYFGCETLPIALRLRFPFSRIVAIAHTHPGQDSAACHPVRRLVERLCHACASDIIFNSQSLQSEWQRKLRIHRIKGVVIPHGLPEPDPGVPEDYPPKQAGTVDFVCVARFVRWKGHRELLRAWREVSGFRFQVSVGDLEHHGSEDRDEGGDLNTESGRQRREASTTNGPLASSATPQPDNLATASLRLVLIGDGPELDGCIRLAGELGVGESVVFMGEKKDGSRYFSGGDVGVLLSIEPEAFGLVLLEAMSRGKAVIASRNGGIPEVVADGQTGLLVNPLDADGVADAFLRLAGSAEVRARLGQAGRERWARLFTLDRMMNDYAAYFGAD